MSVRWETHRGDEYWYTDYWCKLDAGFNGANPGILSIDKVEFKPGQLSERRVHELLWSTQQQFKENKIEVCSHRELLPLLEALQKTGVRSCNPTRALVVMSVDYRIARPDPVLPRCVNLSSRCLAPRSL